MFFLLSLPLAKSSSIACVSGVAVLRTLHKPEIGVNNTIIKKIPFKVAAKAPHQRLLPFGFCGISFASFTITASSTPFSLLVITTCSESFSSVSSTPASVSLPAAAFANALRFFEPLMIKPIICVINLIIGQITTTAIVPTIKPIARAKQETTA